jgi:methylmalonyl-CoA mutase C-terminal domain/subunit
LVLADQILGVPVTARILLAKTGLDGHWRGIMAVAHALRDAGFDVLLLGMARADEIVAAAVQEDVDLIGLNVGGRIEVVTRIVTAVREAAPGMPIFAGGTLSPAALRELDRLGIPGFPPGSPLTAIVASARKLTAIGTPPGTATQAAHVGPGEPTPDGRGGQRADH